MVSAAAVSTGTMLDLALGYLLEEWSVFPVCSPLPGRGQCREGHPREGGQRESCKHPGKTPLVKWAQFQDRLPTEQEVRSWWRRWPEANIGCATGELSGFVVVDLDGELAMHEAEQLGYGEGPWAFTGRVGGRHLYFRYRDDAPTLFSKRNGIDFRGQGGYVLLPGSLHHSGNRYRWGEQLQRGEPLPPLPAWVDEMADAAPGGGAAVQGAVDFEAFLRDGIPLHERNEKLWKSACKMRGADWPLEMALVAIRQLADVCQPLVSHAEAEAFVRRAYDRYPANPAPSTPLIIAPTRAVPDGVDPATGEVLKDDYPWQTLGELVRSIPQDDVQLVRNLIWQGRCHWVFGAPGTGKTLTYVAAGMHMAAGVEFGEGRTVQQGRVLLVEEDSPLSVMSEYVADLAGIYGFDLDTLPFWITKQPGLRLMDNDGYQRAVSAVVASPAFPPALLILDAAERLTPSDRYTTREYDPLTRFVQWCLAQHITVVVIDHTRKQPSQPTGEVGNPVDLLYGGRAKSAISDVMVYVAGKIGTKATMTYPKFRGRAPAGHEVTFDSASGFVIRDLLRDLSPLERSILRAVAADPRSDGIGKGAIVEACQRVNGRWNETAIDRAVSGLVKDGYLTREGENRQTVYRVPSSQPGVLDDPE